MQKILFSILTIILSIVFVLPLYTILFSFVVTGVYFFTIFVGILLLIEYIKNEN